MTDSSDRTPHHTAPTGIRPSAWRALRRGIGTAWDHAGIVVVSNLVWLAGTAFGGSLVARIALGAMSRGSHTPPGWLLLLVNGSIFVLAGVLAAGPAKIMARCFRFEPPELLDLAHGLRQDGLRYGLLALLSAIICGGCGFYTIWLAGSGSLRLAAPLPAYLGFAWLAALPYSLALVSQQDRGAFDALKQAWLLLLDNPLFTVLCALGIYTTVVLLSLSGIGLGLAAMTAWLSLGQAALREVMRKYRPDPDDPEPGTLEPGTLEPGTAEEE